MLAGKVKLHWSWWWAFAVLIAAPALALAVMGLRAVDAEKLERQQRVSEQQTELSRLADVAIRSWLSQVENELRKLDAGRQSDRANAIVGTSSRLVSNSSTVLTLSYRHGGSLSIPNQIILSVRSHEGDRVRGLEVGADDYVTKPFSLREVVARVKAAMRRLNRNQPTKLVRVFGSIELDLRGRRVLKRGREIGLTHKEFEILRLLIERAGEVIARDEFLDLVWGEEVYVTQRVIDTHMASLRRKIEDDPDHPRYILSVRGIGYRLDRNLTEP